MERQNNEAVAGRSSIALLRERFRRLQQIKEMREERQILQILTEAEQVHKRFFHHNFVHPFMPPCGSPFLSPMGHVNSPEIQLLETSLSLGLWSKHNVNFCKKSIEIEVDTSLHL